MGIGPVYAIPMALRNAGLQSSDVNMFEASTFSHPDISELFISISL